MISSAICCCFPRAGMIRTQTSFFLSIHIHYSLSTKMQSVQDFLRIASFCDTNRGRTKLALGRHGDGLRSSPSG